LTVPPPCRDRRDTRRLRRGAGRTEAPHLVEEECMSLTRRELLIAAGLTATGAVVVPSIVRAQTPKRGGTLSLRLWDPPHFDLHAGGGLSYKLHTMMTFTHSRLVRHKVGPSVAPGTCQLEPDLAESWTQPKETTYVFKLGRG